MNISLEIIALITGIIGSITGVISLILLKSKPKITIESAYFKKENVVHDSKEGDLQPILIKMKVRNLGYRSSTIEDIHIQLGHRVESPNFNLPITIKEGSSEPLSNYLIFKKKDFEDLYQNGELFFKVTLTHTFKIITKEGKTDFKTGHFTIPSTLS